jgi:hypothetical protein
VPKPEAKSYSFEAQKIMYGGKAIRVGEEIFVFDSENEGGTGLIAMGVVTSVDHPEGPWKSKRRFTPRVSVGVRRTAVAQHALGRKDLKPYCDRDDSQPRTEIARKLYRQATNKIAGISGEAAAFLRTHF